jgi:HEAT repeat protein
MGVLRSVTRAAGVGEHEAGGLVLVAGVFAALEGGRAVGEVGVNTLVLSRLPGDALPYLYIGLGAISLVIALAYGAALGRVRRVRLFGLVLIGIAALLGIERVVLATGSTAILPAVWLTVMAAGTVAGTIGWTVAASSYDARQAKRLFPLCTAAAISGYFLGSLASGPLAAALGAESLIAAEAILFVVAVALIVRVARTSTGAGWTPPRSLERSVMAELRAGFDYVRESPLMRLVAVAYVLFAVLAFSVTFPFLTAAHDTFPTEAELATALGALTAAVTAVSLAVSLVVANRFYARLGIAAAALVLPIVYLLGFGVWIVGFSFATAAAFVFVQQVTQRGLSNAAWSAFYNVVPAPRRAQVLAFQDGVPGQVGTALSGVLLLTAARLLAPDQVFWLGLAAAAILTVVVWLIRGLYADSILRTLRSGIGERVLEGGPAVDDLVAAADVRATLIDNLSVSVPPTRALAAVMLARSTAPDATAALATVLGDPDPTVRAAAAEGLLTDEAMAGTEAAEAAEGALRDLIDGGRSERLAAAHAMARLGRRFSATDSAVCLADPSPEVRAAMMPVVGGMEADIEAALVNGLHDPAAVVRRAAARSLSARRALPARVAAVLTEPSASADTQEAALVAMEGHRDEVEAAVLTWAETKVGRAMALAECEHVLREHAGNGASPAIDDDLRDRFLWDTLARRRERAQDLLLGAMSVLGAPSARGVIRRCLRWGDPDVRAQAIEALDSLGDHRLGRALTRLVEHQPAETHLDREETLRLLRDDDDAWIAGLARSVAARRDAMPDTSPELEHLETMLQLRRVPLFERLEPEDLLHVAMIARERSFEPGATLIREGEVGDEMFVLLEGVVRVTRHGPDGEEQSVGDVGPGDHIGELAVLREGRRSGTVTAGDDRVRTLVIGGEGLQSILRERPAAAMAMLASLAERISAH